MLANNTYPQDYIDACRSRVSAQQKAYAKAAKAGGDSLEALEPEFFNNMVIVLDHYFAHRTRGIEGKNGNPLNEVRVITNSLMEHGGTMTGEKSIKLAPETSVLGIAEGERIAIGAGDFERLANAYFAELQERFGEVAARGKVKPVVDRQ